MYEIEISFEDLPEKFARNAKADSPDPGRQQA